MSQTPFGSWFPQKINIDRAWLHVSKTIAGELWQVTAQCRLEVQEDGTLYRVWIWVDGDWRGYEFDEKLP